MHHGTMIPNGRSEPGGARDWAALWKISMTTMRPPQHGHGGRGSVGEAGSSS